MRLQAYEVVYQTMEKGEHSDSVFHRIVEQNDFLTRDKRFLKRLSYGTIERSVELDAILNQFAKIQVLKMTAPFARFFAWHSMKSAIWRKCRRQ